MKTLLNWELTKDCVPSESGNYICITSVSIIELSYSKKYKSFNTTDNFSQEQSDKMKIDVIAWLTNINYKELIKSINNKTEQK